MGEFSIWHWLIVLLIVVTIFGTKRLRNVGSDLGSAIRQYKKSLNEDGDKPAGDMMQDPSVESPSSQGRSHDL